MPAEFSCPCQRENRRREEVAPPGPDVRERALCHPSALMLPILGRVDGTSPAQLRSWQNRRMFSEKERAAAERALLETIREQLPALREPLEQVSSHWGYEDPVYRFYHQSFKVYQVQKQTEDIVRALTGLSEREFHRSFTTILEEGTGGVVASHPPHARSVLSRALVPRDGHQVR
jgi:hypothetical protein